MNNDTLWILIVAINAGGFFIQIERPIWAYYLQKWTTINIKIYPGSELSTNLMSLATFFILLFFFTSENPLINHAFFVLVSIYTFLAVVKLINAIPIAPQPKRLIVKVLDAFVFYNFGRGGPKKFIVLKAENPDLGVRVLPAFRYSFESTPRQNSNVSILYRKGLLGIIYRFSFDYK